MAKIPESTVEMIREKTNILDVVRQYVQLKKQGKNWFGLCPFQPEKTPSFSVAPDKQIFHCFSCGRGGNVFTFLMDLKNISFPEAVLEVAKDQNINIPKQYLQTTPVNPQVQRQQKLIQVYDDVARLYHHILMNTDAGVKALDYLHQRGLTDDTIKTYNLGYAPPRIIVPFLKEREKLSHQEMENSGLVSERQNGELGDRFFNRVIYPIRNSQGHTIAFSGRILQKDAGQAKYLNSPETIIFHKGRTIFNYDLARSAIRKNKNVILFEGFMDVISAYQSGVQNGIASMGTSLTNGQIADIERITDQLYICYDGDEPGQKAINRAIDLLTSNSNLNLGVIQMPSGIDPDEYRKQYGASKFVEFINNARETAVKFKLHFLKQGLNLNNDENRLQYIDKALNVISTVNSPIERDYYLKRLADDFEVDKATLQTQLSGLVNRYDRQKIRRAPKINVNFPSAATKNVKHYSKVEQAERCLLYRMLHSRTIWVEVSGLDNFHFYNANYQLIYMLAGEYFKSYEKYNVNDFCLFVHNEKYQKLIMSIEKVNVPKQSSDHELKDYVNITMYIAPLTDQIKKLEKEIKQASQIGDLDRQVQLGTNLINLKNQLNKQIHTELKL